MENATDIDYRYLNFVLTTITKEPMHQGTIHSTVKGKMNPDVIFFNITGKYRYCPQIQGHHRRNSTAILVNRVNDTYAIRCKDPQCNNRTLEWKKIPI